ncbi:putative tail adaptor protein [Paracoccus phage vB_PmaP_KLEP18-1]|nr:putative tail adaptor protein [Paracoccus phage vB_PmaP_KLEP18-1]
MTTLNDVVAGVSDQLARYDLNDQITREIGLAITRLSRKLTYLTEVRGGLVLLNPDQAWYSTFFLTSATGLQQTTDRGNVPFSNVLDFDFVRYASADRLTGLLTETGDGLLIENPAEIVLALEGGQANDGGLVMELPRLHYREFEQWDSDGALTYRFGYAVHSGQFGCRPEYGAGAAYFSGHVKPLIPTVGQDTSVFFDQAQELVEAAVCKSVCAKYIMDMERAAVFGVLEAELMADIQIEGNRKAATGRLAAND